jgi:hypothetical protein
MMRLDVTDERMDREERLRREQGGGGGGGGGGTRSEERDPGKLRRVSIKDGTESTHLFF